MENLVMSTKHPALTGCSKMRKLTDRFVLVCVRNITITTHTDSRMYAQNQYEMYNQCDEIISFAFHYRIIADHAET